MGAGGAMVRLMLVSLMGADGVSHRSVCVRRCVMAASLWLMDLLVQIVLPIILLPLRIHDERVSV